ncbi:MAG: hypothetical protein ONB16_00115 [candidate division KSB1 bacterium]|nr:hypothetical protein [candidate division KSB1 bacterium]MDZ7317617.1 hypothetical protein [candidate division KSB1 bacterium]MDZ7340286.1 hypothetical protein [candidate division KSB1 bacterium]
MIKNSTMVFLLGVALASSLWAQQTTLDWKLHTVGRVRQVVTNTGGLNAKQDNLFDFPRLINCEYPPNTFEEHITEAGLWIGAIVGSDSLVSVAQGEGSSREFYPSDAPWDTIWVINRGDTVDIPYWPRYVGISDQDFVCRYSDYNPVSLRVPNHRPLYLDVIQTSYAWSSNPLDEFVVLTYYIMPTKIDLHDVYLTSWINGNVGYAGNEEYGLDDETYSRMDRLMQICVDLPGGGDGDAIGAIATKVYPPTSAPSPQKATFMWYNGRLQGLPYRDGERYEQMSRGTVMQDQSSTGDGTKSMISIGPYSIRVGDTLKFTVGIILGKGIPGVIANADYLDWLIDQNFAIPSPPPAPPLRVESRRQQVHLSWKPQPGDINPETYQDPNRADGELQPFEGYRVYKSTRSATGPWTLLAEFDLPDNAFYQNTGLEYEYTDIGLLNNLEYYYTVTAFSKPDAVIHFPSLESSLNANSRRVVPGPEPPQTVGEVAVVPNPYRGDIPYHAYNPPWEKPDISRDFWMEQDRRIQFINLPARCDIKIYTLAGDLVSTLNHNNPVQGYEDWNLTSSVGQAIASGIYLFSVEDLNNGKVQVGKFIIIK